ncbi:NUDIX domain-containing protein [Actinoplanes sp. TRM 88003]|uniref:NUDIX domain-containing protein n=1 Tax=Paractinoplanes aksuensis TaxID=2939490 RepID=A0ABT1DM50_9ACTN|nr:NUDIX domain-containing protein [Actinoplanes aksuensis]MCO8271912.1 NUDIX domain-containing protein [Actinoplanes aksuensis]
MTVVERRAARVLLVDPAGRALLLFGGDPARPGTTWWFTPGGGLESDETPAQGAARELYEEVGLQIEASALGEPFWHQQTEFSYGGLEYSQEQHFFVLRVPEWQVDFAGMDDEEKATITAHRWWSADEIEASAESIFPVELPGLLWRLP